MDLYSSDGKKFINVGTGSIWYSIYSTVMVIFSEETRKNLTLALDFLKTGECKAENIGSLIAEWKAVQSEMSCISPEKAVYDLRNPEMAPPWKGNIAATVTSCADLYTTADGKDLFTEVASLLEYSFENCTDVLAG